MSDIRKQVTLSKKIQQKNEGGKKFGTKKFCKQLCLHNCALFT